VREAGTDELGFGHDGGEAKRSEHNREEVMVGWRGDNIRG